MGNLEVYNHIGLYSRCSPSGCAPFPSVKFCSSLSTPHSHHRPAPVSHPHNTIQIRAGAAAAAPHHYPSTFCPKWRSAGFLLHITVIFSFVGMATAGFILLSNSNGNRKRHSWKILARLMGLVGVMEMGAVGTVAEVRDYEPMFQIPGYELGRAWWMGMGSGLMAVVVALGVGAVRMLGRSEGEEQRVVEGERDRVV